MQLRIRRGGVAALTVALTLPSLARADARAGAPDAEVTDPFETGDGGSSGAAAEAPADVLHPDLAAEAPQSDWIREGYGTGTGAAQDPRAMNRKIRTAGRVTLAGGGIAVLGGAAAITGAILLYGVRPSSGLSKLASQNMGALPTDNDKRHRLITIARTGPILVYAGLGVLAAGIITAAIARIRLKKLREQRRTSIVSISPTMIGRGAEISWGVRF